MRCLKGIIFALVSSGTFGLIPLFSIPLADEMNSGSILFYRFFFSAIIMSIICLIKKENLRIKKQALVSAFSFSLLYAATALFLIHSYKYVPSGIATTIHFLYPILVSILMVLFFKEKRSLILFIAAFLSLIGVLLMCWTDADNVQAKGIFIVFCTVFFYAFYIISINQSKVGKELSAESLTFYILVFGAIIFFFYTLITGELSGIPNITAFGRIISLAVLVTVVSDLTLILAIKYIGSTVTSILGSMEPLVAVLVGVLYFSEHFTLYSLLGIILIILSVSLVVTRSTKKAKSAALDANVNNGSNKS